MRQLYIVGALLLIFALVTAKTENIENGDKEEAVNATSGQKSGKSLDSNTQNTHGQANVGGNGIKTHVERVKRQVNAVANTVNKGTPLKGGSQGPRESIHATQNRG
jgi:hypothetical protein